MQLFIYSKLIKALTMHFKISKNYEYNYKKNSYIKINKIKSKSIYKQ